MRHRTFGRRCRLVCRCHPRNSHECWSRSEVRRRGDIRVWSNGGTRLVGGCHNGPGYRPTRTSMRGSAQPSSSVTSGSKPRITNHPFKRMTNRGAIRPARVNLTCATTRIRWGSHLHEHTLTHMARTSLRRTTSDGRAAEWRHQ